VVVAVLGVVLSATVSLLAARKYGDVAGAEAARKFEKEDAQRARLSALRALVSAVELARKSTQFNINAHTGSGFARMPVGAFERAFVSGRPGLDPDQDLLDTVTGYLSRAYAVDFVVDVYLAHVAGPGSMTRAGNMLPDIKTACDALPDALDTLSACLHDELDRVSVRLRPRPRPASPLAF